MLFAIGGAMLEVKINREIREYQENIFFGLNLRQLTFSILAIAVAVGIYFGFRNILGTETVSWLCILGAFPFGAMGFIRYNGMTAEQFAMAFVKSEFLMPKQLCFESEDLYWKLLGSTIESKSAATRQVKKKNKRKRGKGCD